MTHGERFRHRETSQTVRQVLSDPLFLGVLVAAVPLAFVWAFRVEPASGALDMAPLSLLAFLVVFPVIEELAFRGLIQRALLSRAFGQRAIGPVSIANIVTTGLFAFAHYPRGGWVLACGVVAPSLALGLFLERHGRLLSPILLHIAFNLIMLIALAWRYSYG